MEKGNIKVLHVPEICQYNDFILRTSEIQAKTGIEILKPNICIDGEEKGSNNLENILKYVKNDEKYVIHFHWPEKLYKKIDFNTFRKQIMDIKNNNIKLVKTIHNLKPHEMEKEDIKKEEMLYKELDGLIFFSKSQLASYRELYKIDKKTAIIPHPNYLVNDFKENVVNNKNNKVVLCVPGRIRKYKQTDIVIKVMEILKDYNIQINVIGKPDDLESVKSLEEYSKLNEKLLCNFNFVPMEDLEKYMIEADSVLLTHEYIWTSGIAVLAANLGVTLIGTLPKIFEGYETNKIGYFLEADKKMDENEMAELIKKAINDGKDNMLMRGNNLRNIIKKNSDEKIGKLYKEFYYNLFI